MVKQSHNRLPVCIAVFTFGTLAAPVQAFECPQQNVSGFTEPEARVEVAAREPGIVSAIHVSPGDRVEAGGLLAELDKTIAATEVEAARARARSHGRIAVAEARRDHAAQRLKEFEKLESSHAVRPMEILSARAELQVADAERQSARDDLHIAELSLKSAQARLDLLDILAPFSGIVETVHREPSELVGAGGDARIVTLLKLDTLSADVFIPADCFNSLAIGDRLEVFLPRYDLSVPVGVRDLGLEVDAPTGLRRLGLRIDNPEYDLLAGERLVLAIPDGGLGL